MDNHSYFIDFNGKEVVIPQYDRIDAFGVYHRDLALVTKNDLYGFIDIDGKEVVKPQYDEISAFGTYRKDLALVKKDGLYGFIDFDGVVVIPVESNKIPEIDKKTNPDNIHRASTLGVTEALCMKS